jgi:hypothetical protein
VAQKAVIRQRKWGLPPKIMAILKTFGDIHW